MSVPVVALLYRAVLYHSVCIMDYLFGVRYHRSCVRGGTLPTCTLQKHDRK